MSSRILDADVVEWSPFDWTRAGDPSPSRAPQRAASSSAEPSRTLPADWERQLEDAARKASQAAFVEGERAGFERARGEFAPVEQSYQRGIAEMAALRPRLRREAERQVVDLAIAVARRILRRQITVDPDAVAGLVRTALEHVSLREIVEIRVHPSQQRIVTEVLDRMGSPGGLRVEGDAALESGALLIETHRGTMDCSVFTQLDEIERGFTDLLGEARIA